MLAAQKRLSGIINFERLMNKTIKKTAIAKWFAACEDGKLYPVPHEISECIFSFKPGSLQGRKRSTIGLISDEVKKSDTAKVINRNNMII